MLKVAFASARLNFLERATPTTWSRLVTVSRQLHAPSTPSRRSDSSDDRRPLRAWLGHAPRRIGRRRSPGASAADHQHRPADAASSRRSLRRRDRAVEVVGPPYSTGGGKIVHARVQRIDQPASGEVRSWDACCPRRLSANQSSRLLCLFPEKEDSISRFTQTWAQNC